MIHFGQMRCGKVDRYRSLFHVVTEFFHVNFIPVVPLKSYVVPTGDSLKHGSAEARIELSLKSVLFAWIRTALIVAMIVNSLWLVRGAYHLTVHQPAPMPGFAPRPQVTLDAVLNPLALVVGFAIFFALTYRLSRASYRRALELASLLGLPEEALDTTAPPAVDALDSYRS
jgi:hypothetical protein